MASVPLLAFFILDHEQKNEVDNFRVYLFTNCCSFFIVDEQFHEEHIVFDLSVGFVLMGWIALEADLVSLPYRLEIYLKKDGTVEANGVVPSDVWEGLFNKI